MAVSEPGGKMIPVVKDVVLVGAGHAHVQVLRGFGMKPVPGLRLTLITREIDTPYSGMLPGLIAGHYDFDDVHIDTGPLARFAGARLYQSEMTGLDLANRTITCSDRPPVPFDILSINTGSTPGGAAITGVAANAIPVKPIDRFLRHFEAARTRVVASGGRSRIGVVGGGAAGVELVLSLEARLRRDISASGGDETALRMMLLSGASSIVPLLPVGASNRLLRILGARGIEVLTDTRVSSINGCKIGIEGADPIELDEVFWATQAAPGEWLGDNGLGINAAGFIAVRDTLQSVSHPDIFAAGDVASMTDRDLPKSGVYAVRQGPVLADNLRRHLAGRPLRRYRPQSSALYLVSTGERHAVGARNAISFEGDWVWRWKDRIDRKFMSKFNHLPEMQAVTTELSSGIVDKDAQGVVSAAGMRCGGCGAKVGADVLKRALGRIHPAERSDVIIGLDAPDDAAIVDIGGGKHTVQTVDHFRAFIDDPYTFGRIAANHALGDIHAMGAEPQTALAIATVPYGLERKVEADLLGYDDRRQRDPQRGRLRARWRTFRRGSGACAGFCHYGCGRGGRGTTQERPLSRRRPDPDETHRHRNHSGGRHARQCEGTLANVSAAGDDGLEPDGSRYPRAAWRDCGHRYHRIRSARASGRDGAGERSRCQVAPFRHTSTRRSARDGASRYFVFVAPAEPSAAALRHECRTGSRRSNVSIAL